MNDNSVIVCPECSGRLVYRHTDYVGSGGYKDWYECQSCEHGVYYPTTRMPLHDEPKENNNIMKEGYAFTADIMDRVLRVRRSLQWVFAGVSNDDSAKLIERLDHWGVTKGIQSIANDGYLHFKISTGDKILLYLSPKDVKPEHEHMWYRIEFPEVNGIRIAIFAFVPPSEAWSPEDDE